MTSFIGLPSRQAQCLYQIIMHIEDKNESPTLQELADALDTTKQNVHSLVHELVQKNRISLNPNKHRSIVVIEEKKDLKL